MQPVLGRERQNPGKVEHVYPLPNELARRAITRELLSAPKESHLSLYLPSTIEKLIREAGLAPFTRVQAAFLALADHPMLYRWLARTVRRALSRVDQPHPLSLKVLSHLTVGEPVPHALRLEHGRIEGPCWCTPGLAQSVADWAASAPESGVEVFRTAGLAAYWYAASVEDGGETSEVFRENEYIAQFADLIELLRKT